MTGAAMPTPEPPPDSSASNAPFDDAALQAARRDLRNRRLQHPGLPLTPLINTYRAELAAVGRDVAIPDGATRAHLVLLEEARLETGGAELVVSSVTNDLGTRIARVSIESDGVEIAQGEIDGHPVCLPLPAWQPTRSEWVLRFHKNAAKG